MWLHDLSPNQAAVLRILAEAGIPMGAYRILDELEGSTISAPIQVYRALKSLRELGLVRRVEALNAFIACEHVQSKGHVALVICPSCKRVSEVELAEIGPTFTSTAEAQGFMIEQAMIEILARCGDCLSEPARSVQL